MIEIRLVPPVGDADEAGDDDGGRDGGQDEAQHQPHRPGETHREVGENSYGSRFHKAEKQKAAKKKHATKALLGTTNASQGQTLGTAHVDDQNF